MEAERATSLRRGLALLFALAEDEAVESGGLGVVRLADLVGSDKSRASRTLKTLGEYGLVERDPSTLAYRLGWRFYTLAARAGERRLLDAAPPLLRGLVARVGERAHLSVLEGREVVTVLSEAPAHAVQTAGRVGRAVPAHCTSSGRALLLDHDRESLVALLGAGPLPAALPAAPADAEALHAQIVAARPRGYIVVDEEFEPGLVAAAAPVRDFSGRIVAAVNVSAPKFRLGDALDRAGRATQQVADELSALLGHGAAERAAETGAAQAGAP